MIVMRSGSPRLEGTFLFCLVLIVTTAGRTVGVKLEKADSGGPEAACNEGFVYCSSLSVCIPSQCHKPSLLAESGSAPSCPTGSLHCDGQSCIQNHCLALVLSKARQSHLEAEEDNEVAGEQPLTRQKRQEPPQGFPEEEEEEEEEEEDTGYYISCPRGTAFCLETLKCAPTCSDGLGQLSDDEADIFEIEEEEEDDDDDDDDDGRYLTCPPGTTFCMSEMSCQPVCGGDRDEADRPEQVHQEEEEARKGLVCPAGQVFCMKVMACVSNCGFFDQKKKPEGGKDGGRPQGDTINIDVGCPEGTVFCMSSSRCIPSSQSCADSQSRPGSPPMSGVCPLGEVWCSHSQSCQRSCGGPQCPASQDLPSLGFSTCVTETHCAGNSSCCRDAGNFTQCVPSSLEGEAQLEAVCSRAPPDLAQLAATDCRGEAGLCGAGSLCCGGQCHGLPSLDMTLSSDCPPGRLKCNLTGQCQDPASWRCGLSCGPGTLQCSSSKGLTCTPPSQCPAAQRLGWKFASVWVLPPAHHNTNNTMASLSSLWPDSSVTGSLEVVRVGHLYNNTGAQPSWNVKAGQRLDFTTVLGLRVKDKGQLGFSWLTVKERQTGLQRAIVQFVLPRLAPPTAAMDANWVGIIAEEDGSQSVRLHKMVEIEETSASADLMPALQSMAGSLLDTFGTQFLDGNQPPVRSLVHFLQTGHRQLGFEILLKSNVTKKSEYKTRFYFSKDEWLTKDSQWKLLNPTKPMYVWEDYKLELKPAKDYFGEQEILVRPIARDFNGEVENGSTVLIPITIQIIPVNDAPKLVRSKPVAGKLRTLPVVPHSAELNVGISARDLAALYFTDVDTQDLGLALLYADTPDWGSWQYKASPSSSWSDVTSLTTFPLPASQKLAKTHRGPVPSVNICQRETQSSLALKLAGEGDRGEDCLARIQQDCQQAEKRKKKKEEKKKMMMKQKKKLLDDTSSASTSLSRSFRKLVGVEEEEDQTKLASTAFFSVSALLLGPDSLLRFQPKDKEKVWTTFQALEATRLVFRGWDGSSGEAAGSTIKLSLPHCCECGGRASISLQSVLTYTDKEDCTGGPVINTAKTVDQCGVCGGDSTSCLDCNKVLNGPAVLECGVCHGDATAAAGARDCAGSCGGNIRLAGSDVCVPDTIAENFTFCDGQRQSDAKINDCGVCYGGNTGLEATDGMDRCGNCLDSSLPPSKCEDCSHQQDDCGVCGVPGGDSWNSCRKKFSRLDGYKADTMVSKYIQVQLINKEINKKRFRAPRCSLNSVGSTVSQSIPFSKQEVRKGLVKLEMDSPPTGKFIVRCTLAMKNKTEVTYETGQNDLFQIYNSLLLQPGSVSIEENNGTKAVELLVENIPAEAVEIACFYRKAKSLKGKLMTNARVHNKTKVDCGSFNPTGGGVYQFGAVLLPNKKAIGNPKVSVVEYVITAEGPVPLKAFLTKDLGSVAIKFNKNIQGVRKSCQSVFSSLRVLGKDPKCSEKADMLVVTLGSDHSVKLGTKLSLAAGNNIRELKSEEDYGEEAAGTVTITRSKSSDSKPDFKLSAPAEICPGSSFDVELSNLKGYGRGRQQINWAIDSVPTGAADVADLKKKVVVSKNKRKMTVESSWLDDGINYAVTVTSTNFLGVASKNKTVKFRKSPVDAAISVHIVGPTSIRSLQSLKLKARTRICGENSTELAPSTFSYFWTTDGPVEDLSKKNSKKLKLKKGSLQGGRTYNFSVLVLSEQENIRATASILVEVESLGPLAKLAASKITYGTKNNIVLDATLSEDRDNSLGELKFEWSCKTLEDGGGCFVYKGTAPARLEEYLEAGSLNKDLVIIESNTLVPATYLFTVNVTKNNMTSSADLEIEIIPGNPPTISPIVLQSKYKPDQGFTINAVISGAEGTCVQWTSALEDGFVFLDLTLLTKSAKIQCFVRDVPRREFPLVIPPASPAWSGLAGGASYKFLVSASHPTLGYSEASVVVETLSPPQPGSLEVSPASGQGVRTVFTIEAVDFQDADTPLTYRFGLRDTKVEKVSWFKRISSSLPTIETVLPASKNGLIIVVEVCDAFDACITTETKSAVTVKAEQLTEEEILSFGSSVAGQAGDKECSEALSRLGQVVTTVELAGGASQTQFQEPLCSLYSDLLLQCSEDMVARLDCTEISAGQELMEFLVNTKCPLSLAAIQSCASLATALSQQTKQCLANTDVTTSALRADRVSIILDTEDTEAFLNARKPDKLGFRRKRETIANMLNNFIRTLSEEEIEQYITVSLTLIEGIERELAQNDSDSVEFQDQYKERLKSLLTEIHDNYMAEMCKGATTQSPPESIRTKDITMTMIKTELSKGSEEKFVFDQRERSLFEASNVKLMDGVYNKYSQWDCGQGADLPCVGLCLGTAVLESDLVTPTSDRLDITTPPRVSKIHDIRLLNPASGADMTKQIQGETLEEPINIQLNVENTTKRSGYEFKCHVFLDDSWTAAPCSTTGISPSSAGDGAALINCQCSVPGYTAVFLTLDNAPLAIMPNVAAQNRTIRFTIQADYNKTVRPRKAAFEENLQKQLAEILNTDIANIQDLRTWEGSVEVSFNLVAPTNLDAGQQAQAMEQFSALINSGQLNLQDLDGNSLDVPSQCVQNCPVEIIGDDVIPIVIAAVGAAVVVFIIIFICCAICMKNKKTEEKLKPLTPPSQTPTYRSFQFADSLEGTKASLQRHSRKNSSVPDYVPSNFNSRVQTQSSAVLMDEINEPNAGLFDMGDQFGVPVAARYKTPTPDQIHMTGPIPDHIMKMAKSSEGPPEPDQLPGTPE